MSRPRSTHPTPMELGVLRLLWKRGPLTVREVLEALPGERAYTSAMSLLNVMFEKKLVDRTPEGKAFRYAPRYRPDQAQKSMIRDVLERVFDGSATALVARLLEQAKPTSEELDAIHDLIADYRRRKEGKP